MDWKPWVRDLEFEEYSMVRCDARKRTNLLTTHLSPTATASTSAAPMLDAFLSTTTSVSLKACWFVTRQASSVCAKGASSGYRKMRLARQAAVRPKAVRSRHTVTSAMSYEHHLVIRPASANLV